MLYKIVPEIMDFLGELLLNRIYESPDQNWHINKSIKKSAGQFNWPHLLIHCHTKFFLLSQIDVKNHLLYFTTNYIHHLQHENATIIKSFKCSQSKNLSQIVQIILSLGIIWFTSEKNYSKDSLQAPQVGQLWDLSLLTCLPNSSKSPWVPEWNL